MTVIRWVIRGTVNGGAANSQLDRVWRILHPVPAQGVNDRDYCEVGRWSPDESRSHAWRDVDKLFLAAYPLHGWRVCRSEEGGRLSDEQ